MKLGFQKAIFKAEKKKKRERKKAPKMEKQLLSYTNVYSKPVARALAPSHGHTEEKDACGHLLTTPSVAGGLVHSRDTPWRRERRAD